MEEFLGIALVILESIHTWRKHLQKRRGHLHTWGAHVGQNTVPHGENERIKGRPRDLSLMIGCEVGSQQTKQHLLFGVLGVFMGSGGGISSPANH